LRLAGSDHTSTAKLRSASCRSACSLLCWDQSLAFCAIKNTPGRIRTTDGSLLQQFSETSLRHGEQKGRVEEPGLWRKAPKMKGPTIKKSHGNAAGFGCGSVNRLLSRPSSPGAGSGCGSLNRLPSRPSSPGAGSGCGSLNRLPSRPSSPAAGSGCGFR